ncbi:hypothetical protein C0993_001911, partial [Termitomyces sp. T159_Od127]
MVRQGLGWVMEGGGDTFSPSYASTSYVSTPALNGFPTPISASASASGPPFSATSSPGVNVPPTPSSVPIPPRAQSEGLHSPPVFRLPPTANANAMRPGATWTPAPGLRMHTLSLAASLSAPSAPSTPGYPTFPPTSGSSGNGNAAATGPPPKRVVGVPKKDDQVEVDMGTYACTVCYLEWCTGT